MNWKQEWTQYRPRIQRQWQKLTDDDLDAINGDRDALGKKLQERYGYDPDEVEEELHAFEYPGDENDNDRDPQGRSGQGVDSRNTSRKRDRDTQESGSPRKGAN